MNRDETAQALLQRANQLLRAGRVPEAIEAHQRLLILKPDLPDSWFNLGYLQRQARQFEAALASYRQAIDRGVASPEEAYLNRAVILGDHLGRGDAAEAELKAALSTNPRFVPALLNLGNLHEDRGQREEARAAYERVLAIDPASSLALARLAGLTSVERADHPIVQRLRQAISGAATPAADKAELGFALGGALDAAAAYDEAFAAYATANRASRASAGPQRARYDAAAHERFVDRLIQAFPEPATAEPAPSAGVPIFICGMFRSGSTLAEQILASHSQVSPGGELDLLPALVRRQLRPYPEAAAAADAATIARLRTVYLDGVRRIHPGAAVVTDKRPDNFLHIGLIKTLFPEARIVHTTRDPLDNCLSVYFLHLSHLMPYALDLEDIAHWYLQYRRLMRHWASLYPGDIHEFGYDEMVADPRPAIERLLDFCGLPWEEACLSFHRTDSLVKTASVWQVRQPLYRRSSGRWRNYEKHLGGLRAALGAP